MNSLRALVCALALLVPGQDRESLKVDVQLDQLVVTVTDAAGHYVTNLNANDFTLDIGGVPQKIAHFTQDVDTPVSIGILIDPSLSMRNRLEAARLAGSRFIHAMRPADDFFLMTFANRTYTEQEFTQNRDRLDKALDNIDGRMEKLAVGFGTNLFPSVAKAAKLTQKGMHRKRALIVISDGGNNSSEAFKSFRESLRDAEILMYAVQIQDAMHDSGLAGQPGEGYAELVMHTIADDTGGRWFGIGAHEESSELVRQFDEVFTQISAELRGQYSIGFYPSTTGAPGNARAHVQMSNPNYKVRFR
jgi:Ca-activated chloride channel homolog